MSKVDSWAGFTDPAYYDDIEFEINEIEERTERRYAFERVTRSYNDE